MVVEGHETENGMVRSGRRRAHIHDSDPVSNYGTVGIAWRAKWVTRLQRTLAARADVTGSTPADPHCTMRALLELRRAQAKDDSAHGDR